MSGDRPVEILNFLVGKKICAMIVVGGYSYITESCKCKKCFAQFSFGVGEMRDRFVGSYIFGTNMISYGSINKKIYKTTVNTTKGSFDIYGLWCLDPNDPNDFNDEE